MSEAQNGASFMDPELGSLNSALTGGLGGMGEVGVRIRVSMHIIAEIQPIDGDKLLIRGLWSRPIMAELKRWSIRTEKLDRTMCSM